MQRIFSQDYREVMNYRKTAVLVVIAVLFTFAWAEESAAGDSAGVPDTTVETQTGTPAQFSLDTEEDTEEEVVEDTPRATGTVSEEADSGAEQNTGSVSGEDTVAAGVEGTEDTVAAGAEEEDITKEILGGEEEESILLEVEEEDILSEDAENILLDLQDDDLFESSDTAQRTTTPDTDGQQEAEEGIEPSVDERYQREERYYEDYEEYGEEEEASEEVVEIPQGPAKIEKARSINFARNLKEYRSPKLAMLMSLILPGAGQAYARNYVKTGIFGAIELGIIAASVAYNIQGRNRMNRAHEYADSLYDFDTFMAYYDSLKSFFATPRSGLESHPDSAQSRMNFIYYYSQDTLQLEADERSEEYYDMIGENSFVQGWDDCEPPFDSIEATFYAKGQEAVIEGSGQYDYQIYPADDSTYLVRRVSKDGDVIDEAEQLYGYSLHQNIYNDKVSEANASYRTGMNILFLLLVNHIVSAIDAGITAKRFNDRLLQKESIWDRIDINQQFVHTGTHISPGVEIRVLF
jgi:hypothetical protein